jgi:hypothetical protein
MLAYARYELTTPLSAEEAAERISLHTIHWRFGRFARSYEGVPPEELYFIGRADAGSFRLHLNEHDVESSSHAVAVGRISAAAEGARVEVCSRPPALTWFLTATFSLLGLPCLALGAIYPFWAGLGWESWSVLSTGGMCLAIVLYALLKGRQETRRFRRTLKALLRR